MRKKTKALLLVLCAIALVVTTVFSTMAYLTSQDEVTNAFTVGNVNITLDEAKVDENGALVEGADRVKANTYHILPGTECKKDPTVHVAADSEDSWIFVKIDNQLAGIEGSKTVAEQIVANGWTELGDGVYYKAYTKAATVTDLTVFTTVTIKSDVTNDQLKNYAGKTITVTTYAIQKAGFDTAAAAWDELNKQ